MSTKPPVPGRQELLLLGLFTRLVSDFSTETKIKTYLDDIMNKCQLGEVLKAKMLI